MGSCKVENKCDCAASVRCAIMLWMMFPVIRSLASGENSRSTEDVHSYVAGGQKLDY